MKGRRAHSSPLHRGSDKPQAPHDRRNESDRPRAVTVVSHGKDLQAMVQQETQSQRRNSSLFSFQCEPKQFEEICTLRAGAEMTDH